MASIISAGTSTGTALNLTGDTSGILQLASNNGTVAVTIDTSQRLGIGTTPTAPLTVSKSANGNIAQFTNVTDADLNINLTSGVTLLTPSTGTLAFGTANTERMRINSSGNVGIGTNNPTRILDIAAANPGGGGGLRVTATTGTNGALMQVANTGGNLYFAIDTVGGGTFGSGYSANIWYDGNYPMRFATNNQTQMAITGTGLFQMNSGYGSVETAYGCRAWVNFNGSGTVAIRGSGNVSSITDNGTGAYRVNFTTNMPDSNYSVGGAIQRVTDPLTVNQFSFTASGFNVEAMAYNQSLADSVLINLCVFR